MRSLCPGIFRRVEALGFFVERHEIDDFGEGSGGDGSNGGVRVAHRRQNRKRQVDEERHGGYAQRLWMQTV